MVFFFIRRSTTLASGRFISQSRNIYQKIIMAAFLNKKFKLVSSDKFDEYMQELSKFNRLIDF